MKIVFSSNIYSLYGKLKDDDGFLDIVEVIKEQHKEDKELQDLDRESVSQVFLFFDLDIHGLAQSIEQSCEQLDELLNFFDNETENGKLFLSYPMVEVVNICDRSNGLMSEDRKLFKICDCEGDGFKHFVNDLCKLPHEQYCISSRSSKKRKKFFKQNLSPYLLIFLEISFVFPF